MTNEAISGKKILKRVFSKATQINPEASPKIPLIQISVQVANTSGANPIAKREPPITRNQEG